MSNELERSQFTAWVSLKKYKLDFDPMMAKAMELMKELQKLVREFSSLFFFFCKPTNKKKIMGSSYFYFRSSMVALVLIFFIS